MKLRHALLTFGLLLILSMNAGFARADDGKKAKALYFAAEQAYTEKKYDEALIGIKAVESLLGSSNDIGNSFRQPHICCTRERLRLFIE